MEGIDDIFIYLDDVLVWGKTKQHHDQVLNQVLERLAKNDMALSIEKCLFGKDKVEYLGYEVSSSGIRPLEKKLQALKNFKQPTSQKDVLHFCGALNYFRTSLRGIKLPDGTYKSAAAVLQPLYSVGTEKLPSKTKFPDIWNGSPSLKIAFEEAKTMLMDAVELVHPNPTYPLALFSDASDFSVGGSLQQLTPQGHYEPLGFYSAHLNETQKKYSVFKKELMGAFKSLRHFLPEVYGRHLVIYVDHLPLQQAFQSNSIPLNDPQAYRMITEIGRFTKDVRHISGIDNVFADFLSRIKPEHQGSAYLGGEPDELAVTEIASAEEIKFQLLSLDALRELQDLCPEIKRIKSGDKPKNTTFKTEVIDGKPVFCEMSSSKARPYVPEPLRHQIIASLHNLDHLGQKSSKRRVSDEFYWPSMKKDIDLYVKCCNPCKKVKPATKLTNTGEFKVPDSRFSHIMVDIVGPLPPSYGKRFLLTAICRTTRFFHCMPLSEASASEAGSIQIHYWSNDIALHFEILPPICELCESLSKMKLISETVLDLPLVPDTPITLPDLHDLLLKNRSMSEVKLTLNSAGASLVFEITGWGLG